MSLLRSRPKDAPPRREREPGEFASVTIERPVARMVTPALLAERPAAPQSLVPELAPERVPSTATEAESEYMGRVAALGCIVCRLMGFGFQPAQVHHIREGQGAAQRAGNYLTLPLCEPHHTGTHGVHGDKGCLRQLRMTEIDLLDITIGALAQ